MMNSWWRKRHPSDIVAEDVARRVFDNEEVFTKVCEDAACYGTSAALQSGTINTIEAISIFKE